MQHKHPQSGPLRAEGLTPLSAALRKFTKKLHQKKYRDSEQLFLVEGELLCGEALRAGAAIRYAVLSEDAGLRSDLGDKLRERGIPLYSVPGTVFAGLCDTKTPQGILAVLPYAPAHPNPADATIVVLDGIADPGNVGTICRTALWFGIRQLILGPNCADRYNPKTLRAGMGATLHCTMLHTRSILATLAEHFPQHKLYGASVHAAHGLSELQPESPCALVMGSEAHGISAEIAARLHASFRIEGAGSIESLNVAAAAAISMYRLCGRLRGEHPTQ